MFVYLDETEGKGYGCLIVKERISDDVVLTALNALENDTDRLDEPHNYKKDSRTLVRGYFHACEDSKNAHSHLCNAINDNIVGKFKAHIFTTDGMFKNLSEAYDLASRLSIISIFSESPRVTFIFEKRDDLNEISLRKWWDSLWEGIFNSQCHLPFVRTYYPDFNYELVDKSSSGIQVVDFILWAFSRHLLRNDSRWFDRIKYVFRTHTAQSNGSWGGVELILGEMILPSGVSYSQEDMHRPEIVEGFKDDALRYIENIQNVFEAIIKQNVRENVLHVLDDIIFFSESRNRELSASQINMLLITFLKVFDNVHLINDTSSDFDKYFWLRCRRWASLLVREYGTMSLQMLRLSDFRNANIRASRDPEIT